MLIPDNRGAECRLEGIDLHRRALIQGDRADAEQRLVHNQFFGNPNFGEISADAKAD
jgi:hypothetical protein